MMKKRHILIILSIVTIIGIIGVGLFLKIRELRKPTVAIVIDDFGYSLKYVDEFFDLGVPITLSILPHLKYSRTIALEAKKRKYEAILHLPLEPLDAKEPLEKTTILCSMDEDDVLRTLGEAIDSVPYIKGVSNHMGSKATGDQTIMKIIFKKIKKDKLYFMDTLVTPDSICQKVAEDLKARFVWRDVFLDNSLDVDSIKKQIKSLSDEALLNGRAIGVGHDRPETVLAIRQMIPELKKAGIKFVFLSELVK